MLFRSAINTALDRAPDGSLVVILPESVSRAIALIKARNPLPQDGLTTNGHGAGSSEAGLSGVDEYVQVHG